MKQILKWVAGLALLSGLLFTAKTSEAFFGGSFCAQCYMQNNFMYSPYGQQSMSPWGFNSPWYMPYNQTMYMNPYMGGWGGMGIQGHQYPGHGGGFAAKPNLYISGKTGTEVSVKVNLDAKNQWLIAVPRHGESGWKGKLQKDGSVAVEGASHPYFYFDYRFDETAAQDTAGFCTGRDAFIPRIASSMKKMGFRDNEIKDFIVHWSVNLPPAPSYCVFPQESKELDPMAGLQIFPKPADVTRVLFLVVVAEAGKEPSGTVGTKFKKAPIANWVPTPKRSIASSEGLTVREWGVGFLQAQ